MKKLPFLTILFLLTSFLHAQTNNSKVEKYEVVKISQKEFQELIMNFKDPNATYKGKVPCIVDFYADWCRPCRMLHPILEDLQKEYKGKLKIYRVDVDVEKTLASKYGINLLPTLLMFPKQGNPVKLQGYHEKEALQNYIEQYLFPTK